MRTLISLLLTAFVTQLTALAQMPVAETGAARSVQQAQSVPDTSRSTPATSREVSHEVKVPAGTAIEIESAYTVSSVNLHPNEYLSFRVLIPVQIDGVIVIEKDALVTARVVEAKRGGHWGKAGRLSWIMVDVVAVDGTRPPVQAQKDVSNEIKGTSHGGEVATKTVVLGALMAAVFPIAPLALMNGFTRGESAVLPEGKRFIVFLQSDAVVKVTANR